VAKDGGLRAVWRLALAVLAYIVWTNGITVLLSYGFDALFTAWGVTKLNLSAAPGYARFLAADYGNIISVVSSAGIAVFSYLAAPGRDRLRLRAKLFGVGALAGFAAVLVAAAGFLALDSVRTTAASPDLTWSPAILLPVYLAAAVAEEFFARGYVLNMVSRRGNRPLGYLASAAVFLFMTGGYALGILGILNMLLFSAVLCALSEKWPNWLNVGIRFGWGYAAVCLFAFPGASGGSPVYTLYAVSEDFLTGGNGGLISGLYMTALLAAALWFFLLRGRKLRLPFLKKRAAQ
jgi:membrane protease YdiL (CAAX protease family)